MDGKRHSAQLREGTTLTLTTLFSLSLSLASFQFLSRLPSLSHTFYFGCMIADLVPAGNECVLSDGEVEGCDLDNSASGIDGTVVLSLDWTVK